MGPKLLNNFVLFHSQGTAEQWSTNLPSAALHANTQIRIYQTSGSGSGPTCCDNWFVDEQAYLDAPSSYVELTKNVPMNAVTPTYSGACPNMVNFSALPTGLTINSTTVK